VRRGGDEGAAGPLLAAQRSLHRGERPRQVPDLVTGEVVRRGRVHAVPRDARGRLAQALQAAGERGGQHEAEQDGHPEAQARRDEQRPADLGDRLGGVRVGLADRHGEERAGPVARARDAADGLGIQRHGHAQEVLLARDHGGVRGHDRVHVVEAVVRRLEPVDDHGDAVRPDDLGVRLGGELGQRPGGVAADPVAIAADRRLELRAGGEHRRPQALLGLVAQALLQRREQRERGHHEGDDARGQQREQDARAQARGAAEPPHPPRASRGPHAATPPGTGSPRRGPSG
jgi:hypothetical protein